MKFLIAPDSFKDSLTSTEAGQAMAAGVKKVFPNADYEIVPVGDGGEGTMQALIDATHGKLFAVQVHGPLNKIITAHFGILGDSKTAVIEMAQASGFAYVNKDERNPLITTTYGTGELIAAALKHDINEIIIAIGGSATVDGGAGMAQALGAKLLDASGKEIGLGGGSLDKLAKIDISNLNPRLHQIKILIASDVTNPLTGPNGAAAVFGPQKGATPEMVKVLDTNLHHYAQIIKQDLGEDVEKLAGAGAAGGLGAGLLAFTDASMHSGVELVLKYTHLAQKAENSDYVFVGEGRTDYQTQFGKTPFGVAKLAKKISPQATVIDLAGQIGDNLGSLGDVIDVFFSTVNGAKTLEMAMKDARIDTSFTAENIARLIRRDKI